jgi:hypothetical protein
MIMRDWSGMRDMASRLLVEATGEDLENWNRLVESEGPSDEKLLRIWLSQRGVRGFTQSYLMVERFGYPDDLAVIGEELVDGQYADRPALRPVYERLIDAAMSQGDVTVQPRKTHVSLFSPARMFARVEAPTPDRIDLYLRLDGMRAGGRLHASEAYANLPVRVSVRTLLDLDDELMAWLQQACVENL